MWPLFYKTFYSGNTQHLEEEQRNSTQQDLHDMDTLPFVRKNSSDENTPFSPKSNKMNQSIRGIFYNYLPYLLQLLIYWFL